VSQTSNSEAVLDSSRAYCLHDKVALRPEPFGALAYHYGNRKLIFLKSARMVTLVRNLGDYASLDAALDHLGLTPRSRPKYLAALSSLAQSDMLVRRSSDS
jgi:mycofactocin biosynthesis protein MftB